MTRFFVDHLGYPDIDDPQEARWLEFLRLAELDNVHVKFPNLTHFTGSLAAASRLVPYLARVVEQFGASRLLWASDWPNVEASYGDVIDVSVRLLTEVDASVIDAVFSDNGRRLWSH